MNGPFFTVAPPPVKPVVKKVETSSGAESRLQRDPQPAPEPKPKDDRHLQLLVEQMAREVFRDSRLTIVKDEGADAFVYRMIDQATGEVVRQWPPENMLQLREFLRSQQAGVLDEKA
ncbi:MAG: flagellar protein FlaG [Maricaulaceae bacterium]|nr:flagellar protein FlaG [Maricaulaceae bacterium]